MGPRSQYPKSFPFLSLPPELQAEVAQRVGDIVALRDLLAIPQVLRSVGPFVRLVTNGEKPLWFCGLEKHVAHTQAPNGLPMERHRGLGAAFYILDLDYRLYSGAGYYQFLRMPIVVFTVSHSTDDDFQFPLSRSIAEFTDATGAQTVGIIGGTDHCSINLTPDATMIATNLTLVNMKRCFSEVLFDTLKGSDAHLPAIRYVGSLPSLVLEYVPQTSCQGGLSKTYSRYKELIKTAYDAEFRPDSSLDGDVGCHELNVKDWEINQLRGQYLFHKCYRFLNMKLNTGYTDEIAGTLRDGELILNMDHAVTEGVNLPPEIYGVLCPGLRKLSINSMGPFFPMMKELWFPHLETLKLTGINELAINDCIGFHHLTSAHLQEISRLLHGVKDLHIDQFIIPLLGFVSPYSLENLTSLTLKEETVEEDVLPQNDELRRLEPKHGKIRLSKLKELQWSSMCPTDQKVLDFTQLSKCFTFPRLKTVLFEMNNEFVSLKDIALQTPRIKTLRITKPQRTNGISWTTLSGIYPTPATSDTLQQATFERLRDLVVQAGYRPSTFDSLFFPQLKSLELYMYPDQFMDRKLEANMPLLEELLLTVVFQPGATEELTIGNFKNLRKFSLKSDMKRLWFKNSPKLEEIRHTGLGLLEIGTAKWTVTPLHNLKILKYTSLDGVPCHNFILNPSVEVDILVPADPIDIFDI